MTRKEKKVKPVQNKQNIDQNDLFNNPMTKAAFNALSEDEKQKYKRIGKELYGHLNFEDGKVLSELPPPMEEAIAYVSEQLKSGLHPSMMDEDEKALMQECYGNEWFVKWGYTLEDLTEIK